MDLFGKAYGAFYDTGTQAVTNTAAAVEYLQTLSHRYHESS